jgi:hypothetical protein
MALEIEQICDNIDQEIREVASLVQCVEPEVSAFDVDVNGYMLNGSTSYARNGDDAVKEVLVSVARNTVVLTTWGKRWLQHAWGMYRDGGQAGIEARDILEKLEEVEEDPLAFIEDHHYESVHKVLTKGVSGEVETKVQRSVVIKQKLKKGCRSKFACALSKLAYNKFGERKMTEANTLVTRKWLAKLLEEPSYKDLRTCDKNLAIDRALFLSFVPTVEFQKMKVMSASRPWENRMKASNVYGGFWSKVCFITCLPSGEDCSQ